MAEEKKGREEKQVTEDTDEDDGVAKAMGTRIYFFVCAFAPKCSDFVQVAVNDPASHEVRDFRDRVAPSEESEGAGGF